MEEYLARKVAKNMLRLRKEKRMNQDEFGAILGITGKHLGRIERGERNPTLEMIGTLCSHFGLDEAYFYRDSNDIDLHRIEDAAHMVDPLLKEAMKEIPRMTPAMRRNLEALFALWHELDKPDEPEGDK